MKNFKRILALVLTFTFVLSMAIVGVSASYQGKWYAAAVDYLDSISISDIGAFGDEPLSRDEFVTWVAKIESHQTIESAWKDIEFVALNTFSDVDSSNHKGAISYSVGREFIVGNGDGTFTPHNTVTFAEACAVIVRLMDYADLVQGSTWDEQVHWYQHIANAYCGAIDDVFLRESETYDPEYQLSKGEGAYLLYSIMNGAYWTGADEDASINRTSYGVDLGEYFGTAPFAKVSAQYVVTYAPLKYTNTTQVFRRYDAYVTGATYDALYDDSHLYQSTGALDTASDKPVVLVNTFTGEYLFVEPATFSKLALAADAEAKDALEVVEVGGVVTLTFIRRVFDAATAQNYLDTTEYVTLTVNEALAADTYAGRLTGTPSHTIVGWRAAAESASTNDNNATRLTDAKVYWNGETLVVNGDEYTIVDEYTGAAYELKVFAPFGIMETTKKALVSVVGYTGDKVYKGATFSDGQKDILLAHGDYASKFDGNTVTETFTLTSDIPSFVAYELEVEGAFATNTSFGVISNFVVDGYFDSVTDTTTPLTAAEAKEIILEPAQGESNVVFSDTDRDGIYDIAVVTESSRALYYTGVNNASYDLGNEYIGGNDTHWDLSANRTREIYDAFGNYVLSVTTLKGNNVGGIVVDQTVKTQAATTFSGGTDNWQLVDTATNKVQLVVAVSNERQIKGGNVDKTLYGVESLNPYKIVDVADLTTGYVFTGSDTKVNVDGTDYYRYIIQNADDTFSIVYIPADPADQVDVDVTLDGVTSTVTFNAGKDLLAAAVAAPGSKLVGHTVKYVADENGIVWCIKDVAEKSAVTGFVTGSGTTKTAGVYNVTLVTSGKSGKAVNTKITATTAELAKRLQYGYTAALFTNSFGIDALFAEEGETTVKVWRFTEAGEAYLLAKGATQATTTYNFASEAEAAAFVEKYGLYRAGKYVITAADGSYVAAPASMFEAAEDFVTTGGYDYYVVDAAEVEAERVFDGNTKYYTKNAVDGFDWEDDLQEFDPDTTYYTIVVTPVQLDWTQGEPEPDPDTTYYTGDDMAWAVADVTDGFDPQTEYFTIVATEVEAELVFDAQETYYTTDGTDYFFADIDEFEDGVTYYTIEADIADGDFDADEDYYVAIDDDFYKVAADQFTDAADSYYVADGDDYVQNDIPVALESTDYFVPDTAGTLTVTRNNFNGLFCHGVPGDANLTGMYYTAIDGETMPMMKATGNISGAFGSLFVAGTIFSYSDGRYFIKDEYRDYYDVTSYVTEDNFDALTEIATLYVLEDGDYVVAEEYDAEAVYYAIFFEEVEYDAYDLFGYIDWSKASANDGKITDYVTELFTGKGVNTYEVKASLTSVWGASAGATDLLTAILDGKLYNAANLAEDDTFTSNDLLYVSLTLDGSGYYALEGVDAGSYAVETVASTYYYDHSGAGTDIDVNGMINVGNDTRNVFLSNDSYNGTSSGYRSRIRFAYSFDIKQAGAATTWVAGGDEWDNSYILKYEKVADTQVLLPVNAAGQVPGEKNEYKMTIGYNPYFVKNVDSNGKVTFKLQWTELAEYKGIIGTTTYKFDPNKAVLIPLYVDSGKTQLVNGSELAAIDYTTNNDYFVDEEGKVWKIDSAEAAYDHDLSKGTTIYDDTNKVATGETATAPTSYNTLKTVEVTKSGDTYKLNINKGLGSTPQVVTIDADKEIVIVTPTDTKVVTITVTTAAKLYEAGQTIFATEYQLNGTTLSVIGTTSGDASEINIPTVSETPTEDPDNPDDPTAEVKTCYITPEGLALDITTGEVFTAVKNAPAAGYYNVSKSGAVKGEAELLDGVVTAISPLGKATGIDGDVVFIQDGTVSDKQPWGVAYSYLYVELYVSSILSQQVPEVTFSYIVVNGVNYVLVDTIAHN